MTKVVHCKRQKYDVYIGRPSIFGNPFSIGKDGIRSDVIQKYRDYFYKRIEEDLHFKEMILRCRDKTLGCFCKPLDCHGDIIAEWLDKDEINLWQQH